MLQPIRDRERSCAFTSDRGGELRRDAVGARNVSYKHSGEGQVTKKHPERTKLEEHLI